MPPHDPLNPAAHDPNLVTPEGDGAFDLVLPNGRLHRVTVAQLRQLPKTAVSDCYIVSTGHGTSGPFTFGGVALGAFVAHFWDAPFTAVEIVSADGFGNRILANELTPNVTRPIILAPIILAYEIDNVPMSREVGLVRLIVPSETDDALRQVKWVGKITLRP